MAVNNVKVVVVLVKTDPLEKKRFRTLKRSAGEICNGVGGEMFEIETKVAFARE